MSERKRSLFLVAGITGQVGGATAERLLDQGHGVRALVRDPGKAAAWAERGVELRSGDLSDADSLAAALEGMDGAFLMIPPLLVPSPDFSEARATIASFGAAVDRAAPPRLVLLSSVGSEQSHGLGNITTTHLMEEALGDLPFPTAFVRAGGFVENFVGLLPMVADSGILPSFYAPTERAIPMVATADLGAEIARLLVEGWDGVRIAEVGTPTSPDDVARGMGEALGRAVRAQAIPREQWAGALAGIGLPAGQTGMYEEMLEGFNTGWIDFGVPGTVAVAGTTAPAAVFARARSTAG